MALLKTKVNIVFSRNWTHQSREGHVSRRFAKKCPRGAGFLDAKSNVAAPPFAVAISAQTTTFREPFGR